MNFSRDWGKQRKTYGIVAGVLDEFERVTSEHKSEVLPTWIKLLGLYLTVLLITMSKFRFQIFQLGKINWPNKKIERISSTWRLQENKHALCKSVNDFSSASSSEKHLFLNQYEKYESYRQSAGLLGRVISPSQGRSLHRTTQTQKKSSHNIDASSGIRTHDLNIRGGEAISFFF
jgi:hypothetical protein